MYYVCTKNADIIWATRTEFFVYINPIWESGNDDRLFVRHWCFCISINISQLQIFFRDISVWEGPVIIIMKPLFFE